MQAIIEETPCTEGALEQKHCRRTFHNLIKKLILHLKFQSRVGICSKSDISFKIAPPHSSGASEPAIWCSSSNSSFPFLYVDGEATLYILN